MTSERRLGIGVIGAGGIARFAHLPNYARNPRVKLVAVCDIDVAKASQAGEDFGVPNVYDDFDDLLANPEVEAVSVTTPPSAHAEPVVAAARAGRHVLCEKPIATTLEEADAMVEAAENAGIKFAMGYQHRFSTELPLVKRIIEEGDLGRLMGLTQVGVGPSSHRVPWFLQKRFAGGGVLMDWGIYTAHTILWLMGPAQTVYGTSAIFRPEVQVGNELLTDVDVEDTIMATLRFQSGAMGSWYAAWAVAAGHHSMSIDGSLGSLTTSRESPGINLFSKTFNEPDHLRGWRHLTTVEPPLLEVHYRKLANFVDAVLDGETPRVTGAEGRDALELVLAVYRSAETGTPVTLPLERSTLVSA